MTTTLDIYNVYISNAAVPLLTCLGSQSPELVYTCLQHIQLLLAKEVGSFAESYQAFFCRYSTENGRSHEWASVSAGTALRMVDLMSGPVCYNG